MNEIKAKPAEKRENTSFGKWFERLGWGAFAFFFIKGLVWLAVLFGMGAWLGC